MNQFIRPFKITPDAHLIQSFFKDHDAPLFFHVNTMILAVRHPFVFDHRRTFLPRRMSLFLHFIRRPCRRALYRAHSRRPPPRRQPVSCYAAVYPTRRWYASWWITERLVGSIELDPRRMRWVVSGDTLDIGDRTVVFQRPPIFDSPTTRTVFRPIDWLCSGQVIWAGAGPDPVVHAEEMPDDELAASFVVAHGWISPWIAMVDDTKYQLAVNRIAELGITT